MRGARQKIAFFIGASSFLALFAAYSFRPFADSSEFFFNVDSFIFDSLVQPNSAAPPSANKDIVIVGIDDRSLDRFGQWPWPRVRTAEGIKRIFGHGAKTVGLAIYLDPSREVGDPATKSTIDEVAGSENLVVGFNFEFDSAGGVSTVGARDISPASFFPEQVQRTPGRYGDVFFIRARQPMRVQPPISSFVKQGTRSGFLKYPSISNVSNYSLVTYFGNQFYRSFALALAENYVQKKKQSVVSVGLAQSGFEVLNFNGQKLEPLADGNIILRPYHEKQNWGNQRFQHLSFGDVLDGSVDSTVLDGKVVIVDVTAKGYSQWFKTFDGSLASRAEIHATAAANILDNNFFKRTKGTRSFEVFLILLSVVLGVLIARRFKVLIGIATVFVLAPAALILVSIGSANFFNYYLLISYSGFGLLLAFSTQFAAKHFFEDRHRLTVERALKGYTSKAVMESIINQGESFLTSGGDRCDLSIFMFDIVGFTALSKKLTPEETFRFLNHVFSITDEIITEKHNGTIDKKMGDACIALFGLDRKEDHGLRAIKAALDIHEALFNRFAELSRLAHQKDFGPGTIQLRIGISTGNVCIGNVGSTSHINFTAVGEEVNLAQRLEAACRPGQVLISEETYKRVAEHIDSEKVTAHGKREEESYVAYRVKGLKLKTS